jgi:hypothetical protein
MGKTITTKALLAATEEAQAHVNEFWHWVLASYPDLRVLPLAIPDRAEKTWYRKFRAQFPWLKKTAVHPHPEIEAMRKQLRLPFRRGNDFSSSSGVFHIHLSKDHPWNLLHVVTKLDRHYMETVKKRFGDERIVTNISRALISRFTHPTVAHEFGHAIHHHLGDQVRISFRAKNNYCQVNDELYADLFAFLTLLAKTISSHSSALAGLGFFPFDRPLNSRLSTSAVYPYFLVFPEMHHWQQKIFNTQVPFKDFAAKVKGSTVYSPAFRRDYSFCQMTAKDIFDQVDKIVATRCVQARVKYWVDNNCARNLAMLLAQGVPYDDAVFLMPDHGAGKEVKQILIDYSAMIDPAAQANKTALSDVGQKALVFNPFADAAAMAAYKIEHKRLQAAYIDLALLAEQQAGSELFREIRTAQEQRLQAGNPLGQINWSAFIHTDPQAIRVWAKRNLGAAMGYDVPAELAKRTDFCDLAGKVEHRLLTPRADELARELYLKLKAADPNDPNLAVFAPFGIGDGAASPAIMHAAAPTATSHTPPPPTITIPSARRVSPGREARHR